MKFQESEGVNMGLMSGSRSQPLRVSKDSHAIHKPCSSSSSSSLLDKQQNSSSKRHPPVIIYTHSPKIIHAQACDFMALVQKLTGMSRSDDEKATSEKESNGKSGGDSDENEGSSAVTEEKVMSGFGEIHPNESNMYNVPDPYFIDAPLFNNEYFRGNPVFQSSNMGNSISSSFVDFIEGFPEY